MILKFLLDIVISIVSFIAGTLSDILPNVDFIRYYGDIFEIIHMVLQTSVNFLYFMIGEAMFPALTTAMLLLTYRYIIFPVIVIIRRIIIQGGDE